MGLLMQSKSQPELNMPGGTGTPTATNENTTDIAQMYLEWAASNPNATTEQAFAAGADMILGNKTPTGIGLVDDFSQMPGLPGGDFFGDAQVDEISEVDTFGPEGQINKGSWRDTVIDISDIQLGNE